MAENSKIEWTDHTFNPWEGCTNAANWRKPLKWNRQAKAEGRRYRVFCSSLADVFEDKPDQPEMDDWRRELFQMIVNTPHLDWLLLTKRPELVNETIERVTGFSDSEMWFFTSNVWIGTSVENQEQADKRIPELLKIPAAVRFLSMEPLLGAVDLSKWIGEFFCSQCGYRGNDTGNYYYEDDIGVESPECPNCTADHWLFTQAAYHCAFDGDHNPIHWVIVGGESGPNARPMHPDWARSIRDQCQAAGLPFFLKQWGEFAPYQPLKPNGKLAFGDHKPPARWHVSHAGSLLSPHQTGSFNTHCGHSSGYVDMMRVGKSKAGRLLDGREWNEFPNKGVTQ